MVLSMLRLLVLGLVIVVPKLAWRPCPRRNGDDPEVGDAGESVPSEPGKEGTDPLEMASSRAAATPLAGGGADVPSEGVVG